MDARIAHGPQLTVLDLLKRRRFAEHIVLEAGKKPVSLTLVAGRIAIENAANGDRVIGIDIKSLARIAVVEAGGFGRAQFRHELVETRIPRKAVIVDKAVANIGYAAGRPIARNRGRCRPASAGPAAGTVLCSESMPACASFRFDASRSGSFTIDLSAKVNLSKLPGT